MVAGDAPRLRILEESAAALAGFVPPVRIPHELGQGVDEVGEVGEADADDLPRPGPAEVAVGRAEGAVDVRRVARREAAPLDERAEARVEDILDPVAVARAEELAVRVLEVLDLVPVAVPVDGEHRVEVALAVGAGDVGWDHRGGGPAEAAVAARGVEEARPRPVVAARAGREPRPAPEVHGVAERAAEPREVPGPPVLPAEIGVARPPPPVGTHATP